jgi:hypothetical protein
MLEDVSRQPLVDIFLDVSCPELYVLRATVDGPLRDVGVLDGTGRSAFYVNPCDLSGGKDLPGTKVRFDAGPNSVGEVWVTDYVVRGTEVGDIKEVAPFVITLGDDRSPPHVHVVSTPARGTKVNPGDKISLKIKAYEQRDESWQTGVMAIQLTAVPSGLVTSKDYLQYRGKSCDAKSWEQKLDATYTVPSDPPPVFQLCAIAEDFAGNKDSKCGEFRTGNKWNGKLRLVGSGSSSAYGLFCNNEVWDGEFSVAVAANGQVQGKGSAHEIAAPQCNFKYPSPATQVEFDVKGTWGVTGAFDRGRFQLAFAQTGAFGAGGHSNYAMATFLWDSNSLSVMGFVRSPEDFTVPVIASGDAEARVTNSVTGHTYTYKGEMTVTMLCQDCK